MAPQHSPSPPNAPSHLDALQIHAQIGHLCLQLLEEVGLLVCEHVLQRLWRRQGRGGDLAFDPGLGVLHLLLANNRLEGSDDLGREYCKGPCVSDPSPLMPPFTEALGKPLRATTNKSSQSFL